MFSVRKDDWKLVLGLGSGGFTEPRKETVGSDGVDGQLYDLRKDPGETENLYKQYPEKVEELSLVLMETR
jgi:arylsulfatase A-like enzyme